MPETANTQIFQFTLGPVQGFVAQARRTRDFWAGSFILSWLSSVAIAAIEAQGGEIVFPKPDGGYMQFLKNGENNDATAEKKPPQQGSIPNRFRATTAKVPTDFKPELISQAVHAAWLALAECVWQGDLQDMCGEGSATRTIWERQTQSFWEISWTLSPEGAAGTTTLLDRRKSWRNHTPPEEPGHKCMLMDGWQELSGVESTALQDVRAFWDEVREHGRCGMAHDVREGEQLCAMAFIKRRFVHYFHTIEVQLPGVAQKVYGWRVPKGVPSVEFLAAAPWLAQVIEKAPVEAFETFHDAAYALTGSHDEDAGAMGRQDFEIDIRCVREAATSRKRQEKRFWRGWAGLDGSVYFPTILENPRNFGAENARKARDVIEQLKKLTDEAGLSEPPSPFYAILLMDGDQLGQHMGDAGKQEAISTALNGFTNSVGDIVREHNGFLVYAGGDDVLALLPLEDALPAAAALQARYRQAFNETIEAIKLEKQEDFFSEQEKGLLTMSAAIEYVHIKAPLARALRGAHWLLDGVAKNRTGRDAVAVRVNKPSGPPLLWSLPWKKALDGDKVIIVELAREFAREAQQQEEKQEDFSSKFFFRMKDVLDRFTPEDDDENTNLTILEKLLWAEYVHSRGGLNNQGNTKALSLGKLLEQCRTWRRRLDGDRPVVFVDNARPVSANAALLLRFLAQKGLERN